MDYTMYATNSGMNTKEWGPGLWKFLFMSILGRYPKKIDEKNREDVALKNYYKDILLNLQYILPCVFCRDSYTIFIQELPIEPFLIGKIELMYWLYLIKDKVNKKLIEQEKKNNIFCTVPSPLFKEVLETYTGYRASCSKEMKKCV